jgi:predicted ester cyclase
MIASNQTNLDTEGQVVAATGKSFNFSGMALARLSGGRLVEAWGEQDNLGLMQQLRG